MFDKIYELVLYNLLGFTADSYQVLEYQALAVVITTVLMLVAVIAIFKIGVFLLTFPFKWLS